MLVVLEAPKLAHVRLGSELVDPIPLDLRKGFLPGLVCLRQVCKGDHLRVEPQPRRGRLQHCRVRDVDEAEFARQVPHEVRRPFQAFQLNSPQKVHGLESLLGRKEEGRGQSSRGASQEEAIVHLGFLTADEVGDALDRLERQEPGKVKESEGLQQVVHVDAKDLYRRRTVAAGDHVVGLAAVPAVVDHRCQERLVVRLNILRAPHVASVGIDAAVCLLGVHGDPWLIATVDEVDEVLSVPSSAGTM
mmetsp:Transcript_79708/g.257801  ORF Transcript_79708/g.257801 Transcript_79708/m.257801 type:complete len:247 (-) Transcript_79708:637-1377(-)